ncbi:MAG: hypothetical protein LBV54_01850 [Puniceicoccales bacterium]|jgi:protein-tyrosine phosphatase|nr:hypothetical protein [Puniceicoccales bacterium]
MHTLFLCSGNYYRSRFAEAVFNFHAGRLGLHARAFSRGLATHLVAHFAEHISPNAEVALAARGIPLECTGPRPLQVSNTDLAHAHHIIAMNEEEHRVMLHLLHPGWEERVEYWHILDTDSGLPESELPRLEKRVLELLVRMA